MKFRIAALAVGMSLFAAPVLAQNCTVDRSLYRDVNGNGYELGFKPATGSGFGGMFPTAILQQKKAGRLYNLSLAQANGYGSFSFGVLNPDGSDFEGDASFIVNFFDANLKSTSPSMGREGKAPKYMFVSGIGVHDYYRRRTSMPYLGDTMWVLSGCRK